MFNFEDPERELQKEKGKNVPLKDDGGVAQLGEHLPCKQGVRSSILLISTTGTRGQDRAGKTNGNGLIAQVVRAHA